MNSHNISIKQRLLTDEDIQAQSGKVTFSGQHSMGSVIAKKESLGGEEREIEEKEEGYLITFPRASFSSAPGMWLPTD